MLSFRIVKTIEDLTCDTLACGRINSLMIRERLFKSGTTTFKR